MFESLLFSYSIRYIVKQKGEEAAIRMRDANSDILSALEHIAIHNAEKCSSRLDKFLEN